MQTSLDRRILGLAVPALGALAADPLLSMVDTALVGHLGAAPLAALGVAVVAFNLAFVVFNFLAYGTTGPVARYLAADQPEPAVRHTLNAVWLALLLGVAFTGLGLLASRPLGRALGAEGEVLSLFLVYYRIRILALTPLLVTLVGHGLFRGLQDTRTPLYITVFANLLNAGLGYLLIYPLNQGIRGAAIATVAAQGLAGLFFIYYGWRRLRRIGLPASIRPRWAEVRGLLRLSRDLLVRTASLHGTFVASTAVATRMGTNVIAGHQVAVELWMFLAMVMDSLAIAGQALIGRSLGMGRTTEARQIARRLAWWGVLFGVLLGGAYWLGRDALPRIFTSDAEVLATVASVFPFVVLFQPLNGYVFVLDGVLIGASDTRFLARGMILSAAAAVPVVLAALPLDWGVRGIWLGLGVLMLVRAVTNGVRFTRGAWTG